MASDKGSDPVASNEYVNLDRRQSSSAIGRGSMPPRPTMRLHRRNRADPGGAAGRPGLCIHRSPFGREHGAEQTECDGPRSARGRTRRMAGSSTNLQCSLSRRRMVFAATRRCRTLALSEVTGGATATDLQS